MAASDILTTFRTNVRAALADTGSDYTDAMIDQAVFSAVSDISRLAPRQQIHIEILHTRTVTAESFTNTHGTWVTLNNYIDETVAVVVTNEAATITYNDEGDDPDFLIDYIQGRIQSLSTGDMSNSATHKITYERSLRHISLNTLTGIIGDPSTVEIARRGGQVYQSYASFFIWGDVLILQSSDDDYGSTSGPALSEGDRIRVWYNAEHAKPGAAAGSYPVYMDDVVLKGAIAYSLFSKHRERQLAAITIRGTASTQLAKADDDQSAIDTLEAAVTTALDNAATVLGLIDALADASIADINTALDKVITHLGTDLEAYFDDALLLGFNTSIESALDGAAALLDESSSDIKTALDKVVEHLETDATNPDSAEAQLAAGDGLINAVNLGNEAAIIFAQYSRAQVDIAQGFINEAMALISQAQGQIVEGQTRVQQKLAYLGEMDRRLAMATGFVDEAQQRVAIVNALYQTAVGYIQEAQGRQAQIDRHIQLGLLYTDNARGYMELIDRDMSIADRLLIDAQERHAEYWTHLISKVEMGQPNRRSAAIKQNPENRT